MVKAPKTGRPTKYDPLICDQIVELGAQGKSKAQIRRDIGIHHSTWGDWIEAHPEFSAAVKEAYELSMAWWEDQGMDGMFKGMKFNATAYIFQVKNRFPREYRDRQEHDVSGVVHNSVTVNATLTAKDINVDDKREALKAFEAMRNRAISVETSQPG
jgi:hypothetical protein